MTSLLRAARLHVLATVVTVGLVTLQPVSTFAQSAPATATGTVTGEVANCEGGSEQPAATVAVEALGTPATTHTTDQGSFSLSGIPAPGVYTIAAADGGGTGDRMYVPVSPGQTIDVGMIDIGAGIYGCGAQSE